VVNPAATSRAITSASATSSSGSAPTVRPSPTLNSTFSSANPPTDRCTAPDCRSRASEPQQQRCAAHFTKCSIASCPRPAHLHRNGRLDLVCVVHYGTAPCLAPSCTRQTSASSRYCPVHKCAVDNCSSPRHASTPNSTACRLHLCTTPACTNPVSYPDRAKSAHCARHTCRTPACTKPSDAVAGGDFCRLHACATPGCAAEARFADEPSHCARHACVVSNCASPRLSADPSSRLGVGLEDRDRCAYHAATRERRTRAASFSGAGVVDWEGLRGRFEPRGEGKRMSDDVERMRRRARENAAREGDFYRYRPEEMEEEEVLGRVRRGSGDWRRMYPTGEDW